MKIAIYARFSSDNQTDASIDAQVRAITEWAEKGNHEIVATYVDEAKTATNDNRPRFLDMIKDSANKEFEAAVVHKLDRFARNRYDAAFYRRELGKNSVQLVSVLEPMDDSPESVILLSVLEGMAEYYSKNLAREIKKGQKENALKCKHNGGIPPLGYSVTPEKTYIINEHEAVAVRLIFDMAATECSHASIIKKLHDMGYQSKSGKAFTRNSIHDILKNEKYTGVYIYNRSIAKNADGQRQHRKSKSENDIIRVPDGMPRIISDETFAAVRARMADRTFHGRATSKRIYLLSGLVFCGECGLPMSGNWTTSARGKTPYAYYICSSRKHLKPCGNRNIRADFLEDLVLSRIRDEVINPDRVNEILGEIEIQYNSRESVARKEIDAARSNLQDIEGQISNITMAVAKGMFHSSLIDKLTDLENQKITALATIKSAESAPKSTPDILAARAMIESFSFDNIVDPEELRRFIRIYVRRITVHASSIDVHTVLSVVGPALSPPKGVLKIIFGAFFSLCPKHSAPGSIAICAQGLCCPFPWNS